MFARLFLVLICLTGVLLSGCKDQAKPSAQPKKESSSSRAAVELKLLVVDDPEMAAAARLLRGEWAERSGGELVIEEATSAEILKADQLPADVVIYPSHYLGDLTMKKWLRPVRQSVLDNPRFAYDDLYPIVRNQLNRFGGKVFGISLGESPVLLALERISSENDEALQSQLTWRRLGDGWRRAPETGSLAVELIARAASCADPGLRSELLFDPESMAPRLFSPPVVSSMNEMSKESESPADAPQYAILSRPSKLSGRQHSWTFSITPSATEVYDNIRDRWKLQDRDADVASFGFSGRMVSVTSSTRNTTSAFKLLGWLTSGAAATQLSSGSSHTLWFRNSQRTHSSKWLDSGDNEELVPLVGRLLSTDQNFLLPRIPGINQYLEILDDSAKQSVAGSMSAEEALQAASREWEKLTEEYGRSQQLRAYRLHLGLEKWSN